MKSGRIIKENDTIKDVLENAKTIATLDLSPKPERDSNRETIRHKPKVLWMQLDIKNQEAGELLAAAGIDVVMDKCIKVEHEKLCT